MDKKEITAKSYTLKTEDGHWLGQIVLTNDGMFASVTDYGNFSFAWRSYGDDFIDFMCTIGIDYFATKMATGMAYVAFSKKNRCCLQSIRKADTSAASKNPERRTAKTIATS